VIGPKVAVSVEVAARGLPISIFVDGGAVAASGVLVLDVAVVLDLFLRQLRVGFTGSAPAIAGLKIAPAAMAPEANMRAAVMNYVAAWSWCSSLACHSPWWAAFNS
jgi:hypothetical protein